MLGITRTQGLATTVKILLVVFMGFLSSWWKLALGRMDVGGMLDSRASEKLSKKGSHWTSLICPMVLVSRGTYSSLSFASLLFLCGQKHPHCAKMFIGYLNGDIDHTQAPQFWGDKLGPGHDGVDSYLPHTYTHPHLPPTPPTVHFLLSWNCRFCGNILKAYWAVES